MTENHEQEQPTKRIDELMLWVAEGKKLPDDTVISVGYWTRDDSILSGRFNAEVRTTVGDLRRQFASVPPARAPQPTAVPDDAVCQHGTAMDVHCCHCHSGFIFDTNHECPPNADDWREAIETALGLEHDAENHTPDWAHDTVIAIREIGNAAPVQAPEAPQTPEPKACACCPIQLNDGSICTMSAHCPIHGLAAPVQETPTPELDNHHNALKCPYCNPDRMLVDRATLRAQVEQLRRPHPLTVPAGPERWKHGAHNRAIDAVLRLLDK